MDLHRRCSTGGVNYFTILVGELNQTIDKMYEVHPDEVLDLE